MKFLKKIFGKNRKELFTEYIVNKKKGNELPADEIFAMKFVENGGKFLYCTSELEVDEVFRGILMELGLYVKIYPSREVLKNVFEEHSSLFISNINDANVYLMDCEYLITSLGGVMLCSNQLNEKKIDELPETFIIFAKTSQMVWDITEGMRGIKEKYPSRKPTGLITMRSFKSRNKNDIMNYGGSYRKTYLILLEDLPTEN